MKIVVIGGTGLIGSKLVVEIKKAGHEVVAASPKSGVDTVTGEGLTEVLRGASVVVDVSNSPSWEDAAVLHFFTASTSNLLQREAELGIGHHVALSVVGTQRLAQSGYFRAKIAQEKLIKAAPVPYSIVHATQFFEFVQGIASAATTGDEVRVPSALIQPIVSDDVVRGMLPVVLGAPLNDTLEIAGPDIFRLDELLRLHLAAKKDPRQVVVDPAARYSGAELSERTLVPEPNAWLGATRFEEWLRGTT